MLIYKILKYMDIIVVHYEWVKVWFNDIIHNPLQYC